MKPTPDDVEQAENLRLECQDMTAREETLRLAVEIARVRAEERARSAGVCEKRAAAHEATIAALGPRDGAVGHAKHEAWKCATAIRSGDS